MAVSTRPIDDPEVRQQHRRQVRSSIRRAVGVNGGIYLWLAMHATLEHVVPEDASSSSSTSLPAVLLGLAFLMVFVATVSCLVVLWRARRRRAALTQPWQRASISLHRMGDKADVYLPEVEGGSWWQVRDVPATLVDAGPYDCQLAGTARWLVVRRYGSTTIMTARRRRRAPRFPTSELAPAARRAAA